MTYHEIRRRVLAKLPPDADPADQAAVLQGIVHTAVKVERKSS